MFWPSLTNRSPAQAPTIRAVRGTAAIRGNLQKGSAERGFPDLFWFVLKTNRNKSEENGTNRGIPENKERKSEQIGRKRGNRNKSGWPLSADPKAGAPLQLEAFSRIKRAIRSPYGGVGPFPFMGPLVPLGGGNRSPYVSFLFPLTLQKKQGKSKKTGVFLFAEALKSLEKKEKTPPKSKENRKMTKSKEIEKSKDWRVRVFDSQSSAWGLWLSGFRGVPKKKGTPARVRNIPRNGLRRAYCGQTRTISTNNESGTAPATTTITQGALKGTELRWQREPKTQTFAENRRFSQIHPFSWKFKHLEGAGNRRKPQIFARKPKIFAENRRKPQIGLRHLRSVTFSSALITKKEFCISCRINYHWHRS